jgi:DNA-binding HxlR family transcriptional regulator
MSYHHRVPTQKGYQDSCGIALGLSLIGERWALLVVRELLLGPRRFSDLRRALVSASPNALTERLRELVAAGVVRRRRLPPPASSWVYELTNWGRELEPIVLGLGTWALRSALHQDKGHLSGDSVMLSIRTYLRPGRESPTGTLLVRLDDHGVVDEYGVRLEHDQVTIDRNGPAVPDAVVTSDAPTLSTLFGAGSRLRVAEEAGMLAIEGDRRLVERLVGAVVLPEPLPVEQRQ